MILLGLYASCMSISVLLLTDNLGVQSVIRKPVDQLKKMKTTFHNLGTQQGSYSFTDIVSILF